MGAPADYVFPGSKKFWEARYAAGGDSGSGSRGDTAAFKASVVNQFVVERGVASVVEFGCGDGSQLSLLKVPSYLGVDVSSTVLAKCREMFSGDGARAFANESEYEEIRAKFGRADVALSLDVIFHLTEDDVFESYMRRLFDAAAYYVLTYSPDANKASEWVHIKYRKYSTWVQENISGWEEFARVSRPDKSRWGFAGFIMWRPRQAVPR